MGQPEALLQQPSGPRSGTPPSTGLMRQLNESGSWFSEVSYQTDEASEPSEQASREDGRQQPIGDGRMLRLAEMFNESATWFDIDVSDSDPEEQQQLDENNNTPLVGLAAVAAAGTAPPRSFSY